MWIEVISRFRQLHLGSEPLDLVLSSSVRVFRTETATVRPHGLTDANPAAPHEAPGRGTAKCLNHGPYRCGCPEMASPLDEDGAEARPHAAKDRIGFGYRVTFESSPVTTRSLSRSGTGMPLGCNRIGFELTRPIGLTSPTENSRSRRRVDAADPVLLRVRSKGQRPA
jgi:hypothetical protein